jgi:hypothetical protein
LVYFFDLKRVSVQRLQTMINGFYQQGRTDQAAGTNNIQTATDAHALSLQVYSAKGIFLQLLGIVIIVCGMGLGVKGFFPNFVRAAIPAPEVSYFNWDDAGRVTSKGELPYQLIVTVHDREQGKILLSADKGGTFSYFPGKGVTHLALHYQDQNMLTASVVTYLFPPGALAPKKEEKKI